MLSNFLEIIFFVVKYIKHKLGHFNNFELHNFRGVNYILNVRLTPLFISKTHHHPKQNLLAAVNNHALSIG